MAKNGTESKQTRDSELAKASKELDDAASYARSQSGVAETLIRIASTRVMLAQSIPG